MKRSLLASVLVGCLMLVGCSECECPECEKPVTYSTGFIEFRQNIDEVVEAQQIRYNNENCKRFYDVSQQHEFHDGMIIQDIEIKYSKQYGTCFAFIKAACEDSDCGMFEINDFINGTYQASERIDSGFQNTYNTYTKESEVLNIFDSL